MEKWQGKVALVTGASAGIGREMAKTLALNKLQVIAICRHVDKLQPLVQEVTQAGGTTIEPIQCDVGKMDQVMALFAHIWKKYKALHICINNAGLAFPDYFLKSEKNCKGLDPYSEKELANRKQTYQHWWTTLEINIYGLSICAKEAIILMAHAGIRDGIIVNVSSIVGRDVILFANQDGEGNDTFFHMYTASKFAITAMTQCLRRELNEYHPNVRGIRVVTLCPGWIKTNFADHLAKRGDKETVANKSEVDKFFESKIYLRPEDVSDALMSALRMPLSVQLDEIVVTAVSNPK